MNFKNISDIYDVNESIRVKLLGVLEGIAPEDEKLLTDKGDWDLAMIVEHLAAVEKSMTMISARLLAKAKEQGLKNDGVLKISPHFTKAAAELRESGARVNAPEIVQPKGGQPVAVSIEALEANREDLRKLRGLFEEYDPTAFTFPHPAFGELTATDWLVLIGGHEARHTEQIERILSRENAARA